MQEDEILTQLHEVRRILADDTLSPEERHRRVEEMLPALLRARFAAENVRLTDEARQAGLRSLLAASSDNRSEPASPFKTLASRMRDRREGRAARRRLPTWRYVGAAAAAAAALAVFLLVRNRPPSAPGQVVSAPAKRLGIPGPISRQNRGLTAAPPIRVPRQKRSVKDAPAVSPRADGIRGTQITRGSDRAKTSAPASRIAAGVLANVMGAPRMFWGDKAVPTLGRTHAVVLAGSRIETGDADQATVRLKDGTTLRLGFNTTFRFFPPAPPDRERKSVSARSCELIQGTLFASVAHQPGHATLTIRTPSAAARVVGTEFGLRVRRQQGAASPGPVEAALWVTAGRVDFYNAHGKVECASMTESMARADSPPTAPRGIRYVRSIGYSTPVHSEALTMGTATERLAWAAGYSGLNVRDQLAPGKSFPWETAVDGDPETKEIRIDTTPTVLYTDPDSPAAVAGIRPGDILLRVGPSEVRTAMSVQLALSAMPPGRLEIVLRRGATVRTISLSTTRFDQSAFRGIPARERSLVDAGARRFLAGDIAGAKTVFIRAIRQTGSAAAMNNLAVILHYEGRVAEAAKSYQDAARLLPREALFHANLGLALLDVGNAERAIDHFRTAAALAPKWEDPVSHSARVYADYLDQPLDAIAAADAWARRWPASPAAWTARAHALRLAGRPEEALQAALRAIRLSPVWQYAYQEAADAYRLMGDERTSEEMYLKALRLDAGSPHLYSGIAFPLSGQGRMAQAVIATRCAIALEPDDFVVHANISSFYRKLGKLDLAIASANRALALEPKYGMGYDSLCEALMDSNRLQEAEDAARKAVEMSRDRVVALNILGLVLHNRGKVADAEQCFLDAIALDPFFVFAYGNLTSLYQRAGRLTEAEKMSRKEIELNPRNAQSYWGLGMILVMLKRLPEAEVYVRKAYALSPNNPEFVRSVADVCRSLDKLDEAEKFYLESLRKGPSVADTHLRLAGLYEQLGRLEEAEREFRLGADLFPDKVQGLGQVALFQARRHLADGGLALAERCLAMAQDDKSRGMAQGFIGLVRIRRNEIVEAERAFRESVALAPNATRWDRLADALEELGKVAEAIDAYRKALELDPNDAAAQSALKRLEPPDKQ